MGQQGVRNNSHCRPWELGRAFVTAKADVKMGDTPTVARLLRGVSDDPTKASWGGRYVPIWDGRKRSSID